MHRRLGRREAARLAGIGEEGDGIVGADEDEVPDAAERGERGIDRVGQPLDGKRPRPRSIRAGKVSAEQTRAGRGGDTVGGGERHGAERIAAEKEHGRLAGAEDTRDLRRPCLPVDRRRRHAERPWTTPPSPHEASEGRIRVATPPGAVVAARTASAAYSPTACGVVAVRTQTETRPRPAFGVGGERRVERRW